jgi:hypothetical protein
MRGDIHVCLAGRRSIIVGIVDGIVDGGGGGGSRSRSSGR